MIKGGRQRTAPIKYTRKNKTEGTYSKPIMTNEQILEIAKIQPVGEFVKTQQENWIAHISRAEDNTYIKMLTFPDYFPGTVKKRGPLSTTYGQVLLRYKKNNFSETQMLTSFIDRNPLEFTNQAHNSES